MRMSDFFDRCQAPADQEMTVQCTVQYMCTVHTANPECVHTATPGVILTLRRGSFTFRHSVITFTSPWVDDEHGHFLPRQVAAGGGEQEECQAVV